MGGHSNRIRLLALGLLLLAGCGGWSATDYRAAEEAFDAPALELGPLNNAVIRYKNIAGVMTVFPDAMQTMDQICHEGLPKNHGHLLNWRNKNRHLLGKIGDAVRMEGYRLRNSDLLVRDRVQQMMRISNLLLVEAAFLERGGDLTEATRQILRSRRLTNQMVSDGGMQDLQVAHLIHYRSVRFLDRLLETMSDRLLQEVIVETEYSLRLYRKYFDPVASLGRLVPMHSIEYLKPLPGDTTFERWAMPSAGTLETQCRDVLDIWRNCRSKGLEPLVRGGAASGLVSRLDGSHAFTQAFFGHGPSRGVDRALTGLVRVKVHAATVHVRDEMLQLKAAALIHRRARKQWPRDMKHLVSEVGVCHATLGKQSLSREPGRADAFTDPFSGKPYGYRLEDTEARFWSVGPDFSDDAGLESWDGRKRGDIIEVLK